MLKTCKKYIFLLENWYQRACFHLKPVPPGLIKQLYQEVDFPTNHPQTVQMLTLKFKYSLLYIITFFIVSFEGAQATQRGKPPGAVSWVMSPTGFRPEISPSRNINNQVLNNSRTKRYIPCLINFFKYSNPTITASIFTLA